MRSFLRFFTRIRVSAKTSKPFSPRTKTIANTMASATGGVTAALYAATFSVPTQSSTAPEDAKNLTHHNKHGKGFINPWPSWMEASPWSIGYEMIRLVTPHSSSNTLLTWYQSPHQRHSQRPRYHTTNRSSRNAKLPSNPFRS